MLLYCFCLWKVQDEESGHVLTYLLQTHSLNNDPKDWDTKVWMCEFEPDVNNPGMYRNCILGVYINLM